jgi:Tfp pilus assembly protein PilF
LACERLGAGDTTTAASLFRQILQVAPDIPEVHNYLGVALAQQGELDAAVVCFKEALHYRSDYPEAHNDVANVLQKIGRLDEAVGHYQEAIRLRPDFAQAYNNFGVTLAEQAGLTTPWNATRWPSDYNPTMPGPLPILLMLRPSSGQYA